ncbi:GntR family transcriptional regulator [Pseudooceanicola sp. 502str34]|uniref:GntR family transcriptional regulator n=1 Tax=Maritimibacter alkaliphilus TaxID=404236 RepID=UPI001C940DB4|nr:GntR family transcriptional regulator [Maritimibacter alkaliphilus]MBY6090867.1 GntR family transcriptional regulator [Maritimibacter alkaliphilus]
MTDLATDPQRAEKVSDRAFDLLHDAIVTCDLLPGEVLSEPQLQQRFGLARGSLRLALDRLIQLRLVAPIHRRGYEVAPITVADVHQVFGLRRLIEPPATGMAVGRVDIAYLEDLRDTAPPLTGIGEKELTRRILDHNRCFHMHIVEAAGNPRISAIAKQVIDDIDRLYFVGLVKNPNFQAMRRDHASIVEALKAGDAARAEAVARAHVDKGLEMAMDSILETASLSRLSLARL